MPDVYSSGDKIVRGSGGIKLPLALGIVGCAADKLTVRNEELARKVILDLIVELRPDRIYSGGCHLGGIDKIAEDIATEVGVDLHVFKPETLQWGASNGYRSRNLKIARSSTLVASIVVREYPRGYTGMRFNGCYHCKNAVPSHVKSGGCWTAWRCKSRRIIIL